MASKRLHRAGPAAGAGVAVPADGPAPAAYWVCVSNERSGDVTVIDGGERKVVATIPAGKRPRGVHPSPDGRLLYVALSGSPITGPPKLDAQGKPISEPEREEDADRAADGIGIIDLAGKKLLRKLPFKKEPEGVALSPDGKFVWVTCETGGEVFVIDTATNKPVAEVSVGGRPRAVAFLPDGSRALVLRRRRALCGGRPRAGRLARPRHALGRRGGRRVVRSGGHPVCTPASPTCGK